MNRPNDRVTLTTRGKDHLRLVDEAPRSDALLEAAAARERAEQRARQSLSIADHWRHISDVDPLEDRLAQRHRFGRELDSDDGQTSREMPLWPLVVAVAGTLLAIIAILVFG